MNRATDLGIAIVAVVVLSPVLIAILIGVKATSGGSALFRQKRVGRGGRDFTIYKFRTMRNLVGAEAGMFTAGDNSRVTPFGSILRRCKLDELPQLFNVISGDMAIVGPRPEVRRWVKAYPDEWAAVHMVRPGITDPASIEYRNEEELLAGAPDAEALYRDVILPSKLRIYEAYVQQKSFLGDFLVICRTIVALFR